MLKIRLPWHGVHGHGQAAATEGVGELLCGGHLEGVLLVDQQGHLRTGVFPGAFRGVALRGGVFRRCKLLERKGAVCALQRGGIPVAGRGDGELGGAAVTQQAGVHQTLPVDGTADRLSQCLVVEGGTAGVEAQKLHDGGGSIGVITAAGYAGSTGAGEIQRQQLDLPGGKGIEHGVPILTVLQLDALQGQRLLPPPVGGGLQIRAAVRPGEHIGAGAGGDGDTLRSGLDDGDIQPPCQRGQLLTHGDEHGVALHPDGGHLRQTGGVAGGRPRPLQRGRHIPGSQGRAVGEGDAASQRQGVGARRRVVGAAFRQQGPENEVLIQLKQLLVQQRTHRDLHFFRGGDGVQALAGEIGQRKGGQRLRLRLLVLLAVKLRQLAQRVVHLLPAGAAGGGEGQRRQQHTGQRPLQNTGAHGVTSRRAMRAACSPRWRPVLR